VVPGRPRELWLSEARRFRAFQKASPPRALFGSSGPTSHQCPCPRWKRAAADGLVPPNSRACHAGLCSLGPGPWDRPDANLGCFRGPAKPGGRRICFGVRAAWVGGASPGPKLGFPCPRRVEINAGAQGRFPKSGRKSIVFFRGAMPGPPTIRPPIAGKKRCLFSQAAKQPASLFRHCGGIGGLKRVNPIPEVKRDRFHGRARGSLGSRKGVME